MTNNFNSSKSIVSICSCSLIIDHIYGRSKKTVNKGDILLGATLGLWWEWGFKRIRFIQCTSIWTHPLHSDLSPPPAGWDTPPLPKEISRESDIARLKYFFNAVSSHAGEGFLSDAVFSSYWQQIHDTLVRLGGADYEDVIEQMRCQEMDLLSEEHFRELLKQWRKVEDNIKDKLNELESAEALKVAGELLW